VLGSPIRDFMDCWPIKIEQYTLTKLWQIFSCQ